MATMEEASKTLLLNATAASCLLINSSRWLTINNRPVFAQNYSTFANMLAMPCAPLFDQMANRSFGVCFLPGTDVPERLLHAGIDYQDYLDLMLGNNETAAGPDQAQTMLRCNSYASKVFQASMNASIRAAKNNDDDMLRTIACRAGLLECSALVWLWLEDGIIGAFSQDSLLFVPRSTNSATYFEPLSEIEALSESPAMNHLITQFIFTRLKTSETGFQDGQCVNLGIDGEGKLVRCGSEEASDYIERVVMDWARDMRQANGI